MTGGLEDRRPATARSKEELPRLLCCQAGGVDQPGARGGGGGRKGARGAEGGGGEQEEEQGDIGGEGGAPPIVLRSTHCIKLQSCGLLISTNDYCCFLTDAKELQEFSTSIGWLGCV